MEILFVTDYVCPYCIVARAALKEALARTSIEAVITWQPFELTPEDRPRRDMSDPTPERIAQMAVLAEKGRRLGLSLKLPPNVHPRPYTRLAFEGWYYACAHGRGDAYADAMYRAYFEEELDIGSIPVLAAIAARLGLDAADLTAALENGTYTAAEQEAAAYARNVLKPSGVPTLFIDGVRVMLKDYTAEELVEILNSATSQAGFACGENDCG